MPLINFVFLLSVDLSHGTQSSSFFVVAYLQAFELSGGKSE